jgi:acyl-CoA synthetase (AMP-forming)/AMP-acid ligase II
MSSPLDFTDEQFHESQAIIGSDHVVHSPYPAIQLPADDLYTLVTERFLQYGYKIGLIDGMSGREYSYNAIAEAISKFSSGIQRLGFVKGDVLTIVAPNSIEFPIVYLGTLAAGGVVSPCNHCYSADKLAYQFRHSRTKYVATVSAILPAVQEAVEKSGAEKIVLLDSFDTHTSPGNIISYNSLLKDSGSLFSPIRTEPDDVVILPYTSGTTLPGIPRGVMLTNKSVCAMVLLYSHPEVMNPKAGDHVIGICPLFHSTIVTLLPTLYAGSTLIVLPEYNHVAFLSSIEKYQNTIIPGVPPLMLFLAKHPLVENYDLASIKDMITGAAPIGAAVMKAASERVNSNIRQAYGLTEAGPSSHMMPKPLGMQNPCSVGVCLPNMKAKIVDPESGKALPSNKEGEVWVHGPIVMKGYLNNPKATRDCITDDGWFKTGDLG